MSDLIWLYSPQPQRVHVRVWKVDCDRCYGYGYVLEFGGIEDESGDEVYCDCEAARWRMIRDGVPDEDRQ